MEQQAIHSLAIGSIYALAAAGLTFVYAAQRSLYLAYGGLYLVGGYVVWWTVRSSYPIGVGLILAVCGGAGAGVLLIAVWRWVRSHRPLQIGLLHGLGVLICLAEGWRLLIGPYHRKVIAIDSHQIHYVGPLMFSDMHWLVFGCSFGCFVVLQGFLTTRPAGQAVMAWLDRGAGDTRTEKQPRLLRVGAPQVLASAIGGALAAVSGLLAGLYINDVHPSMGVMITHKIMSVGLIGTLGSLRGAVCAAYGLALIEGVVLPAMSFPMPSETVIVFALLLASVPSGLAYFKSSPHTAEAN